MKARGSFSIRSAANAVASSLAGIAVAGGPIGELPDDGKRHWPRVNAGSPMTARDGTPHRHARERAPRARTRPPPRPVRQSAEDRPMSQLAFKVHEPVRSRARQLFVVDETGRTSPRQMTPGEARLFERMCELRAEGERVRAAVAQARAEAVRQWALRIAGLVLMLLVVAALCYRP